MNLAPIRLREQSFIKFYFSVNSTKIVPHPRASAAALLPLIIHNGYFFLLAASCLWTNQMASVWCFSAKTITSETYREING